MIITTTQCLRLRLVFLLTIVFWCWLGFSAKAQYTVESVPNPKDLPGKGWVSDPDHLLASGQVQTLNNKITQLERQTTAQVAVVVLKSIRGQNARDFGVALFRRWGIGQKQANNGLLLLVVMEPRRWEFVTGYGLEGDLPDVITSRIGHQVMVPYFKNEQFGEGLLAAINEVERILTHTSASDTSQVEMNAVYESNNYVAVAPTTEEGLADIKADNIDYLVLALQTFLLLGVFLIRRKQTSRHSSSWDSANYQKYPRQSPYIPSYLLFTLLIGTPLLVLVNHLSNGLFYTEDNIVYNGLVLYGEVLLFFALRRWFHNRGISTIPDSYERFQAFTKAHKGLIGLVIFFPLPFLLYAAWYFLARYRLRHAPRMNKKTGLPLLKLSEEEDDAHLTSGQLREEKLGSVDYDVWKDADTAEVEILGYDALLTRYQECAGCGFKTGYLHDDITISSPTYSSTGEGEKTYACKHCSHTERKRYTIPRRQRSSSSSGGSSSGGSSFGGGSTGGGGSGGSW